MATKTSSIATTNPATGEVIQQFDAHTPNQIDTALRDAHSVWRRWRERTPADRAKIVARAGELMLERRDELAALLTLEMGKLRKEAVAEVELSASILAYSAQRGPELLADEDLPQDEGTATLAHESIGVLLAIEPWNFPYYQVMRVAGPNLVAGNVIVLKHASINPQCALAIEKLFADADAPAHVFTNLFVSGADIGQVIEDPRVAAVTITGSERSGANVGATAGKQLKKSVLELGGSDPFIVLEDADMETAVQSAVTGRLANAGQVCTSTKRLIVVGDERYDQFVEGITTAMREVTVGDPSDDDTQLGPLSSKSAVEHVEEQVQEAISAGATCVLGGHQMDRPGFFFEPTLLTDIDEKNPAYSEELFGPVAMVYRATDEDDAVRIANDVRFGLGATILTADPEHGAQLARRIEAGMVWINQPTASAPDLPFGGVKSSGYGRELGDLGIFEFTNQKLIRVLPTPTDGDAQG